MPLLTLNAYTNEPRGSQARVAIEHANGNTAYELSRPFSAAGITIGTTVQKAKTVNTLAYTINGRFYSKAATDDFWTLSGTTVPVNSFQKYYLLIDAAGTASIQEAVSSTVSANAVKNTNISNFSGLAPLLSILNTSKTIVGVITVATNAAVPFVPGTTALNAAGITATYIDGLDPYLLPLSGVNANMVVGLTG